MAVAGGTKRKRGGDGGKDGSRPSPHRPGNLSLAQTGNNNDRQGGQRRGGRRGSRHAPNNQSPQDSPKAAPGQMRSSNATTPTAAALEPGESQNQASETAVNGQSATSTQTRSETAVSSSAQPPPPPPTPPPFDYEYLTDEAIDQWSDSGRKSVIERGMDAKSREDVLALNMLFQELVRASLDGKIDSAEAGSAAAEILGDAAEDVTAFDPASALLDTISIMLPIAKDSPPHPSHVTAIQGFLLSCGISSQKMREELDLEFVMQVGLTRTTFDRMRTRYQTNVLYRQSNYNLLREESEGYSKLMTELFTTSLNEPPNADVVNATFERVKAMIGAFDLDVGRVLDITLDVFANVLVRNSPFFIKYLRISTWWPHQAGLDKYRTSELSFRTLPKWASPNADGCDTWDEDEKAQLDQLRDERDRAFWERARGDGMLAYFELGGRRRNPSEIEGDSSESAEKQEWIKETGIEPPPGNNVAAQVLGFKLRFYNSAARSANDSLHTNMLSLAALLIKVGFISLQDLYAHLWPLDGSMGKVKDQKMAEKAERERLNRPGGGAKNALAMAGALGDEGVPAVARVKETDAKSTSSKGDVKDDKATATKEATPAPQESLPEPTDQKVQLLKSLLCIGALPEALFMLGRFPWLPDAFPDLPEYINRILHYSLSKLYAPLRPLQNNENLRGSRQIVDPDQAGVAKGSLRLIDQPAIKQLRWAFLDKFEPNESTEYRFYWDEWADNIPICQTIDDVFTLCNTLLNYSGVKIGQDPLLLTKLARIGRNSLEEDPSEENKARWLDLSKKLLVPALSLTKRNSGAVDEVWQLIKQYPTITRYSIYNEWHHGATSRRDDIAAAFEQSRAETKDVLKRISKTNLRKMAKALAKVTKSSPGVVFSVAIGQIESYDNLVEVVVDCAQHFDALGYDVLTWSLMNALGGPGRRRLQADGMLTSRWLTSLSLFCGKVFMKYDKLSPSPILQYVTNQLQKGNSTDLIVLEQMISSMAGIVSDTNFNEEQTVAMAGGPIMQSQIMMQLLDRRHESAVRSTAKRLMKSLIAPHLVGPLLVSIAQKRQTCIFKMPENDAHLKLLGNLFDEIHRVLTQYLDLLRTNLSAKEFDKVVPSLDQLVGQFGIDPSVAFWISRPSITAMIADQDKKMAEERKGNAAAGSAKPENASDDDKGDQEANDEKDSETEEGQHSEDDRPEDATMQDAPDKPESAEVSDAKSNNELWHPELQELIQSTCELLPSETFQVLSHSFYFTFWQMSLEDIFVPMNSYNDENARLKKKIASVSSDRSDLTLRGTQRKEAEKKKHLETQEQLNSEFGERVAAYQRLKTRLNEEKHHWFANCGNKWEELNMAIIEHCFVPRIKLSPLDALYTFKLFKHLHSVGTKNFRTIGILDQLFNAKRLTSLFFSCTAKEADNIGRFFNELIKDLNRWHSDKAIFEKEAHGSKKELLGFVLKYTDEPDPSNLTGYEDFRRILQKWHLNIHNALKDCLKGGEYMHIRNAITILKSLTSNYPVINWMGMNQVAMITDISRNELREDLKLSAASLLGSLRRREKDWIMPQAFSISKAQPGSAAKSAAKDGSNSAHGDAKGESKLNAKASEFTPAASSSISVSTQNPATGRGDREDGEVESPIFTTGRAKTQDQDDKAKNATNGAKENQKAEKTGSDSASERRGERNTTQPRASAKTDQKSNLPARPTNGRSSGHNLPARPDAMAAPARPNDRRSNQNDRGYGSDGRDSRSTDYRNDLRASDHAREGYVPPHGPPHGSRYDRNAPDPSWGSEKPSGRYPPDARDGRYANPPRDARAPMRDDRMASSYDRPRGADPSGRQSRDGAASGRNAVAPGPPAHHDDRSQQLHRDRRGDDSRLEPQQHGGSQRNSRASSPSRRDDRSGRSDYGHRDDRTGPDNRRPEDSHRGRHDEARAPAGPRSDRAHDQSSSHGDRFRDSFNSHGPNAAQDSSRSRHEESRYGRLNQDGPAPPPGPRQQASGGRNRASSQSQPGANQQNQQNQIQAPTGPQSSHPQTRGSGRGQPAQVQAESPPGIHPDRLKAMHSGESNRQQAPSGPAGRGHQQPSPTSARPPPPQNAPGGNRVDKRFQPLANLGSANQPERQIVGTARNRGGRGGGMAPPGELPLSPDQTRGRGSAPPRSGPQATGEPADGGSKHQAGRGSGGGGAGGGGDNDRAPLPRDGDRRNTRRREGRSASPGRGQHAPPPLPPQQQQQAAGGPREGNRPSTRRHSQEDLIKRPSRDDLRGDARGGMRSASGPYAPPGGDQRELRQRGPPGRGGSGGGGGGDDHAQAGGRDSRERGPPPPQWGADQRQMAPDGRGNPRGRRGGGPPLAGGEQGHSVGDGQGSMGRKRGRTNDEGGYDGGKRTRR